MYVWGCVVCGMKHESSESKFFRKVTRFIQIVAENGKINRFAAARQIGMTPRQYDQMHPYLMEAYADILEYDSGERAWIYRGKGHINKPITEESEIPIEDEGITEEKDDIQTELEIKTEI